MSEQQDVFHRAVTQYLIRLLIACFCVSAAVVSGRLLFAGFTNWPLLLMTLCATATGGFILTFDVSARWFQLRRLRVIESGPKPFGQTSTTPRDTAAHDLGRTKSERQFH